MFQTFGLTDYTITGDQDFEAGDVILEEENICACGFLNICQKDSKRNYSLLISSAHLHFRPLRKVITAAC